MKILVCDPVSPKGIALLQQRPEFDVVVLPKRLSEPELLPLVKDVAAMVVRSETKVTRKVIEAAPQLRVVGRAGVGVDNVDVEAATQRGVVVMNTPGGNTVSTAELSFAMLLNLARKVPQAHGSMVAGKWDRKQFQGTELAGRTLGVLGLGRIGSEVAKRALAFGMRVLGYDPFLSDARAKALGIELLGDLDDVYRDADFITIHMPVTDQTRGMLNAAAFAKMKPKVCLVNCARGEIVDEAALVEALQTKRIAGAAIDVFENEPPKGSKLLELDNVVLTPHLGASTKEAQEKVSMEMAEHVKIFLLENKISNAVNAPMSKMDPKVAPFVGIAERLGSFCLQLVDGPVKKVEVEVHGEIANLDTKMVTVSALIGVLSNITGENTNVINANHIAREKGIQIMEAKVDEAGLYTNMLVVRVHSDGSRHEVRGTAFPSDEPRLLGIDEFDLDMPLEGDFILTKHEDMPGMIGRVGSLLGSKGINIAQMGVGREGKGKKALMLISVDDPVNKDVLDALKALPNFKEAHYVRLSHMKAKEYMNV